MRNSVSYRNKIIVNELQSSFKLREISPHKFGNFFKVF